MTRPLPLMGIGRKSVPLGITRCRRTLLEQPSQEILHQQPPESTMELEAFQERMSHLAEEALVAFHKLPGSAVLSRYIQSSYQNDPVRSAIELVLFLFFVRYLMAPSYSTHKRNFVKLREDVSTSWRGGVGWDHVMLDRQYATSLHVLAFFCRIVVTSNCSCING